MLEKRLDNVNYYFDSDSLAASHLQTDPIKKVPILVLNRNSERILTKIGILRLQICICINNIEHLKNHTISKVPEELDFEGIFTPTESSSDDIFYNEKLK